MIRCDEVRRELELYVVGEAGRAEEIRGHLSGCAECEKECGRAAAMVEMLDREFSVAAPAGLAERAIARVGRHRPKWLPWAGAAALLLSALAALAILRPPALDGMRVMGQHEVLGPRHVRAEGELRVEVERRGRPAVVETPEGRIETDEGTFEVRDMKTLTMVAVLAGAVQIGRERVAAGESVTLRAGTPQRPFVKEPESKPEPPKQDPAGIPPKQDPPKPEPKPEPVPTRTDGTLRIAVVDLKKCFDPQKYALVKEMNAQLEKAAAESEQELMALDQKMHNLAEQMKGIPDKTSQLYLEKFKEFRMTELEREMVKRIAQMRLADKRAEVTSKVYNEIRAVVSGIAVQDGYDLVLRVEEPPLEDPSASAELIATRIANRVVLYGGERLDITARVIERLNQEYEKKKK